MKFRSYPATRASLQGLQVLNRGIAEGSLSVGGADDGDAAIIPSIGRQA